VWTLLFQVNLSEFIAVLGVARTTPISPELDSGFLGGGNIYSTDLSCSPIDFR